MSYVDPAKAPKDDTVITEAPGIVTSDSLAAESYAQGQADNDPSAHFDAVPQSVPSKGITANTTDNTNATILPPAPSSSERSTDQETYAAPGDSFSTGNIDDGAAGAGAGNQSSDQGAVAPSYVSASLNANAGELPKGDATEGGFDSQSAARPRFDAEPGSRADPGREAVKAFERANATSAAAEGGGAYSDDQGGFENLDRETAA